MAIVTKQGDNLLRWLKHWKLASKIADAKVKGALTPEAKEDEKRAIKIIGNMIKSKYRPKWAR